MIDKINPDYESICRIDRKFPWMSPAESYPLQQRDVFIRLSGGVLSRDGRTWKFPNGKRKVTIKMIREHNAKVERSGMSVFNPSRRFRPLVDQALRDLGVTREEWEACVARLRRRGLLPNQPQPIRYP